MANPVAIRNEGNKAEQRFLDLVEDSRKSDEAKSGDAIVRVDGTDEYVEIKKCSTSTVNQIRAIKYICCAVWASDSDCWCVIPPHELVELAANKNRGQHNEIAFECMNLGLSNLLKKYRTSNNNLSSAIHEAIRKGREFNQLPSAMNGLLRDIRELKKKHVDKVKILLNSMP